MENTLLVQKLFIDLKKRLDIKTSKHYHSKLSLSLLTLILELLPFDAFVDLVANFKSVSI